MPRTTPPTRIWFERVSISFQSPRSLRPSALRLGLAGLLGRPAARTPEIFLYPFVVQSQQFRNRSDRDHLPVGEHRDTVADGVERVEIVRDQEDGEAEPLAKLDDQLVEGGGADRIEAGGRLVEEQQLRDRARARGRCRRASACRRKARPGIWGRHPATGRSSRSCRRRSRRAASPTGADRIRAAAPGRSRRRSGSRTGRRPGTVCPSACGCAWSSSSSRSSIGSPNTRTSPSSGRWRPMIERISTDLPVPEPPTTPRISPRRTSRSSPSWMTWLAEAVAEAVDLDDGLRFPAHSQPISVKKTAKKASRTMTRKIAWTTAVVVLRPTSSAFDSTCMPWKQPAMRDDQAEDRRLDQQLPEVGHRHDLADALDEGDRRDVERDPAEDAAADDRDDRGVEAEQRHHQHGREDAREDQRLHRRDADRAHRVDFLGQLHRADLGGEGGARAAGDHDRGHQHAELLDRASADQVDGEHLGAELAKLDRALLGDDDPDQEAHQPDDPEGVDPDHLEALDDGVEAEAARLADDVARSRSASRRRSRAARRRSGRPRPSPRRPGSGPARTAAADRGGP